MMKRRHSQEQAKFWRDPDLENLEILHVTYLTHSFALHSHDAFATSVIDRGAGGFFYRGATHIAPAGSLVMLNPDEMHTGYVLAEEGWTYRVLYPSTNLLSRIASDYAGRSRNASFFPTPIISDAELANLMHHLHRVLEEPTTILERESWLLQTYAHMLTRHVEHPPVARPVGKESHAVRQVRDYIEAHFHQNVSLSQLALLAGLTPYHLVRVFHSMTGLPPHAYLNQVRLAQAKRLLLAGLPIADVTYEIGFADQSHLTKRFKRVYGITPGQMISHRKNVQD
jgi:AraC-like DNA-binding protein